LINNLKGTLQELR
jgi:hypothetical protein